MHKYNEKGELVEEWENGFWSPTTILGIRHNKGLQSWREFYIQRALLNGEVDGIASVNDYVQVSSDSGTRIHDSIEHFMLTGDMITCEEDLPKIIGFMNWHDKYQPLTIETEFFCRSDIHKFAGRIDWIGVIDDMAWIVDWKSGGQQDDHELQLSAYRQAYYEMTGIWCRIGSLTLKTKNKQGYAFKEYVGDFDMFLHHKAIFEWNIKKNPPRKPVQYAATGKKWLTSMSVV